MRLCTSQHPTPSTCCPCSHGLSNGDWLTITPTRSISSTTLLYTGTTCVCRRFTPTAQRMAIRSEADVQAGNTCYMACDMAMSHEAAHAATLQYLVGAALSAMSCPMDTGSPSSQQGLSSLRICSTTIQHMCMNASPPQHIAMHSGADVQEENTCWVYGVRQGEEP